MDFRKLTIEPHKQGRMTHGQRHKTFGPIQPLDLDRPVSCIDAMFIIAGTLAALAVVLFLVVRH